jgi:hypothetical protein
MPLVVGGLSANWEATAIESPQKQMQILPLRFAQGQDDSAVRGGVSLRSTPGYFRFLPPGE